MMDEILMMGVCAFCKHCSHDFPDDAWHEMKHDEGWHACDIDGCFRYSKPLCRNMEMRSSVGFYF